MNLMLGIVGTKGKLKYWHVYKLKSENKDCIIWSVGRTYLRTL